MTEMRLATKLRHNLGVKILSIVLALLLWSFVHGLQVVQREINVPIRYTNLPDSLMLYSDPPQSMRVLVSGRTSELFLRMRFVREVQATVDLSTALAPSHRVLPSVAQVTSPRNPRVTLVRVLEPQVIDLRIVRRLERRVPVRVVFDGAPGAGTALVDSVTVQPPVVLLTGPDFMVESLPHISTVPVGLRRHKSSFTDKVALFVGDERLEVTPREVSVSVPLARMREQELADVSLQVTPPPDSLQYELSNPQVKLVLRGPEARMASLTVDEVQLSVDLSLLGIGVHDSVTVVPHIPGWSQLVRIEPARIQARIRAAGTTAESTAPHLPAPAAGGSSVP